MALTVRHILRPALLPFSWIYGLIILVRNQLFDLNIIRSASFKIPVISIGNITAGGTGKTPHVEFLARLLKHDFKTAILSRGYKRKSKGFILASKNTGVHVIGDEPLQMKSKFPGIRVAVDSDRVHGINMLINRFPALEVILLDDAYQHRYVKPGLSILLVDFNRPVFNDYLLPAGNLREFHRNTNRADIIMITKCPKGLTSEQKENFLLKLHPLPGQHVFFTRYQYGCPLPVFPAKNNKEKILDYKKLRKNDTGILLVTGIANPKPLKDFLSSMVTINRELAFPDHHDFSLKDIAKIKNEFTSMEAQEKLILVTEKDAMRLRETEKLGKKIKKALYYIPIEAAFLSKGEKQFIKLIYGYIKNQPD